MKVYKFRGIDNDIILSRDINSFKTDQFFAPNFENLNDKFEANFDETISETFESLGQLFNIETSDINKNLNEIISFKQKLGVFCLSKNYLSETLWAYYASNNQGYCIEYDLEKLTDKNKNQDFAFQLDVQYSDEKPIISIFDIQSGEAVKKMFATKKVRWTQEEEIRLIFDNSGLKKHHESAITGIYFGCDTSDTLIERLTGEFNNRDIRFYKIIVDTQANKFDKKLLHQNIKALKYSVDKFEYYLAKTIDNITTTNYYLYIKKKYQILELQELALAFKEKFTYKPCNIYFINNVKILDLIEKYPKTDEEYIVFADAVVADFPFDCENQIFSYPYRDWYYEEITS